MLTFFVRVPRGPHAGKQCRRYSSDWEPRELQWGAMKYTYYICHKTELWFTFEERKKMVTGWNEQSYSTDLGTFGLCLHSNTPEQVCIAEFLAAG